MVAAAALAALCAVLACSGAQRNASSPATAAMPPQDPRAQIEALDREIASDMLRAHVAQPPIATCSGAGCAAVINEPFSTPTRPTGIDAQCQRAPSARCSDACTLSSSICRNQEKICELARQLPGDDWAANKCESARASCKAAHDRCCSCA